MTLRNTGWPSCSGEPDLGDLALERQGDLLEWAGHLGSRAEDEAAGQEEGQNFSSTDPHSGHFLGGGKARVCTRNVLPSCHIHKKT